MNKYSWTENDEGQIFIYNQEESVKPKNIVEKIDFESEFTVTSQFGRDVTLLQGREYFKSPKMLKWSDNLHKILEL